MLRSLSRRHLISTDVKRKLALVQAQMALLYYKINKPSPTKLYKFTIFICALFTTLSYVATKFGFFCILKNWLSMILTFKVNFCRWISCVDHDHLMESSTIYMCTPEVLPSWREVRTHKEIQWIVVTSMSRQARNVPNNKVTFRWCLMHHECLKSPIVDDATSWHY